MNRRSWWFGFYQTKYSLAITPPVYYAAHDNFAGFCARRVRFPSLAKRSPAINYRTNNQTITVPNFRHQQYYLYFIFILCRVTHRGLSLTLSVSLYLIIKKSSRVLLSLRIYNTILYNTEHCRGLDNISPSPDDPQPLNASCEARRVSPV